LRLNPLKSLPNSLLRMESLRLLKIDNIIPFKVRKIAKLLAEKGVLVPSLELEIPVDYKEVLKLVNLAAEGKDYIEMGSVGYGGYGFVFRDLDFFEHFPGELNRYRPIVNVGDQPIEKIIRSQGECDRDEFYYYYYLKVLMIGSLKTLLPSLEFKDAKKSDILFEVWVIIKTPQGKIFPLIYHYDRYRMALGISPTYSDVTWLLPRNYRDIFNVNPNDLTREERATLAETFENALKKVPTSDYRTIYPGHDYSSHIEINNGVPLFADVYEGVENLKRERKGKWEWDFEWGTKRSE